MIMRKMLALLLAVSVLAWPGLAAAQTAESTVAAGDTGRFVEYWQDRLNDWVALSDTDLDEITVDGVFGPETEDATTAFQDATDAVPTDAVVHPEDRVALREAIDRLESDEASDTVVASGDTGRLVAFWQDRLNDWRALAGAGDDITIDGIFGPETEQATLAFQEATDELPADAVVHPEDRVALRKAIDDLESDGSADTVVAAGDTGRLVAFWQDRLNDWFALSDAAEPITVDGVFGPETEQATQAFQDATDAVPTDAVVDPEDRVALREAIEAVMERRNDGSDDGVPTTDAARSPNFPATGMPALLKDVTASETADGVDQVTFTFDEGDDFSFEVDYVEAAIAPSGQPITVAGQHDLLVKMAPAAGVDLSGAEPRVSYTGPERIDTADLDVVREIAQVEDFESMLSWVIGTAEATPFSVEVLEDPLRLVVTLTQS